MNEPENIGITPEPIDAPDLSKDAPSVENAPVLLTKEDFTFEASATIAEYYPNDEWHKFIDDTLVKLNEDQQLQNKGGIYLHAIQDKGHKIGVAAVRWEQHSQKAYSFLVGLQWEITAFVKALVAKFGPQRPTAKARADLRRAKTRSAKKKSKR